MTFMESSSGEHRINVFGGDDFHIASTHLTTEAKRLRRNGIAGVAALDAVGMHPPRSVLLRRRPSQQDRIQSLIEGGSS
jgi:hypothetical protein